MNFTLIDDGRVSHVAANLSSGRVCLSADAVKTALGWEATPQGWCQGTRCIPIGNNAGVKTDEGVDLIAFAALLARPLALDTDEAVACLGTAAEERAAQLASLAAPDFTLPDFNGRQHALSDYLGKKVLLVAYASW